MKKNFKNSLVILAVVALVLSVMGCGSKMKTITSVDDLILSDGSYNGIYAGIMYETDKTTSVTQYWALSISGDSVTATVTGFESCTKTKYTQDTYTAAKAEKQDGCTYTYDDSTYTITETYAHTYTAEEQAENKSDFTLSTIKVTIFPQDASNCKYTDILVQQDKKGNTTTSTYRETYTTDDTTYVTDYSVTLTKN